MAKTSTVLEPDPRLLGGPIELTRIAIGDDELNERFRQNEELVVEELSRRSRRVTLRELVAFNEGTSGIVPAISVPCQVRLIDFRDESVSPTRFILKRESHPPHAADVFVLRPLMPVELPSPRVDRTSTEAIDSLLTIAEQGSDADLEMFLTSMQLEREAELVRLRRLAEIHRDAVQNAVDILQTKRIDFLESPQEAGIEGSIMAFVVAQIAGGVITSVVGTVVELVATGVFSIIGRWEHKRTKETISAFIKQRQDALETTILSLKGVQRKFVPENARAARKSKNRLQNIFKERIGALKKDIGQAKMERRLLLQGLLEDSMVRAQALRARLNHPIKKPDGGPDLVNKAGELVTGKATEAVSGIPTAVTQTKADSSVRTSAIPLDVAMKMEVQDYFDPWLAAVEDSIRFLKQARLAVVSVGLLPEDAIDEIIALVELSGALDEFSKGVSSLTAGSVDLRADLTSFYELLLWLTMYRPRLSKMPTVLRPGGLATDRQGNLLGPIRALPKGDQGTMNLLKYLALRFFGMGKIEGEGKDAELVFSDEELSAVYEKTEELCAKLFAPQPAQRAAGDSSLETTLSQLLKTIRFVVMPYEKQ